MVQVWSLVRGMDTSPHKEAGEHTEETMHRLTFHSHHHVEAVLISAVSLLPSVVSSGTDNEAISICEAYISQVSRMAQKAFVFGLKQITCTSSKSCFSFIYRQLKFSSSSSVASVGHI